MITAVFKLPLSPEPFRVASPFFESVRDVLTDADGRQLAIHKDGMWESGQLAYISIDFEKPVTVEFSNPELRQTSVFGPLAGLRLINGAMWDMEKQPELLAKFDEVLKLWHIYKRPEVAMIGFTVRPAQ